MPQAQVKVLNPNDLEDSPKTISADDIEPGGATGSWEPPTSDAESEVRAVLEPLARFGKSAATTASSIPKYIPNTITAAGAPPQNDDEILAQAAGGGLGLLTHRMVIQPTKENAKAWWDEVSGKVDSTAAERLGNLAGSIPIVGPMVKDVIDTGRNEGIPEALGKAVVYAIAPKVIEEGAGIAGKGVDAIRDKSRYAQEGPPVFTTPEGHLIQSLKPDLDPAGIKIAGDQLKQGEARIGKPVKDIDSARAAAQAQFKDDLMPQRRAIIDPQKDMTVPGSRRRLINAKIQAIPADIRPGSPEYASAVERAKSSVPSDLTIGELEEMNSSLNAQTRAYHQAKLSQALSKLESTNGAMDVAAERSTRQLMQDGMSSVGLGGGNALKEVNQRIGTLIKLEDAIDSAEPTSRVEATVPKFRRLTIPTPSNPSVFKGTTVNEGIANAMRTWKTTPTPIRPNMRAPLTTNLLSSHNSTDLGPAPDGSYVEGGPAIYSPPSRPKMITAQAGGPHALPEEMNPEQTQSGVTGIPGQLAKGPFSGKPIVGKQLPLQPTVIRPVVRNGEVTPRPATPIFGERQVAGEVIPKGTTFTHKSTLLDGTEMWHYTAPDGHQIVVDHEIPKSVLDNPPSAPYEPGTSWRGNPYGRTEELPPPPKRTSKKVGGKVGGK